MIECIHVASRQKKISLEKKKPSRWGLAVDDERFQTLILGVMQVRWHLFRILDENQQLTSQFQSPFVFHGSLENRASYRTYIQVSCQMKVMEGIYQAAKNTKPE